MSNQTIPTWLSIAATIATVISAFGVVTALWQILVTTKQFKKQVEISNLQLQLTKEHFRIQNQGYLSIDMAFEPIAENEDEPNPCYSLIHGVEVHLKIKNVGHLPVIYKLEKFKLRLQETVLMEFDKHSTYSTVHPTEEKIAGIGFFVYDRHNQTPISIDIVTDHIYSGLLEVSYKDFNSDYKKKYHREFVLQIRDNGLNVLKYPIILDRV